MDSMHLVSGTVLERWNALSDEQVVAQVLAGQTALFEILMRRYNERVYRAARAIVRDDREAEDVIQQAYVNAYAHLRQFNGKAQFATWLTRIAINEALGRARSARPHVELGAVPEEALEAQIIKFPVSPAGDPERTMAQREIQRVVERAIDELPDAFRMVFIARVMEGMTIEETSDLLGVKPETVKTRLHRARTMLRENVEKEIGPVMMDAFPFAGWRCERLTEAVLRRLGVGE